MNDKLSLQDLADILSQQTQISKKEAEFFFKEFFQLILDRIYENDLVKVKDFGTFKLTAINSRESVDVNTGEKIEIPAHYRFTFLPDKALKELVNEPFSQYQTVLLEDGMDPSDVKFELQTNTEENKDYDDSIDSNEVSKVIQEQVKLVNELKAQIVANKLKEPKPVVRKSKIDLIEKIPDASSNKVAEVQRVSRKPFVYTYSTSKADEDRKDDDVILMTVPRGRISKIGEEINISQVQEDRKPKPQDISPKKIDTKKEIAEMSRQKDTIDVVANLKDDNTEAQDSLIEIDTTIYLIPDDIDDKKDLESVSKEKRSKFNENSSTTSEQRSVINVKTYNTKSNPDRPLIPEEVNDKDLQPKSISTRIISSSIDDLGEIDIDTTFIDANEGDVGRTHKVSNVGANLGTDFSEETEVRDVQNDPFFNFEEQSAKKTKRKKNIPIIILIVIALLVVVYSLFKLFDVKYDYERYLGLSSSNLTMADTLPYVYEKEAPIPLVTSDTTTIQDYSDSLSDQNTIVVDAETSATAPQRADSNTLIIENADGSLLIDGSADVLNKEAENAGVKKRKVSNNLSINIVDKAQYFIQKRNEAKNGESLITDLIENQADSMETDKSQKRDHVGNGNVITLEQGMTLRSIASKYYGNSNYWVYIYMANKAKLPNPDAIMVGLELSIPPLNQYGIIDPKDPKEIERAQRLESSILR